MTLMERASTKTSLDASADDALLTSLREKVGQIIPPADAARLIASNPRQARSEISLACERVIAGEPWLLAGRYSAEEVVGRYLDEVFGLGPLEEMLSDDSITEVMVNGSKSLYYERNGRLYQSRDCYEDDAQVFNLIDKIVGPLGRRVDESSPMVNARLPHGHRVNAIIPPLALDGPVVTIRKFRAHAFSLDEMRSLGSFDHEVDCLLRWAVRRRCNIAVSGGTGSGKTTLLNALSALIPPNERIVTIEDSAELRFDEHPHVVRLEARQKNAEGIGEVLIRDLVINSLRMRPDRIVVGECRGAEALDMPHIRFHDLRHTAATNMHQLTGDFYTVGEVLGHTLAGIGVSLGLSMNFEAVTARYVDVRLERKKEVLDAYHGAVKQADPAKAEKAEPKKAKSAAKKKSSDLEL